MSGVKGRSGPRKKPPKVIQEYLYEQAAKNPENITNILEAMAHSAIGWVEVKCPKCGEKCKYSISKDLEAGKYYIDRLIGRPHQSIDQRVKTTIAFTPDDYELATRVPRLEEQKLIEQYSTKSEDGTADINEDTDMP